MRWLLCCWLSFTVLAFGQNPASVGNTVGDRTTGSIYAIPAAGDIAALRQTQNFAHALQPQHTAWQAVLTDAPLYQLDIRIADDMASIEVQQQLFFYNRSEVALDHIVLRMMAALGEARVLLHSLELNGQPLPSRFEQQDTVLRLEPAQAIAPGQAVHVQAHFSLLVPSNPRAYYGRFGYYAEAEHSVLSVPYGYFQLAMHDAQGRWDSRRVPEFADPVYSEASFFLVDIHALPQQRIIAPGALPATPWPQEPQRQRFAFGPARDFYWASVTGYLELEHRATIPLDNIPLDNIPLDNIPLETESLADGDATIVLRSYTPPPLRDAARRSLEDAAAALEIFTELLGAYPYREFILLAVPLQAGGMEYAGLINVSTPFYRDRSGFFELIVVHEVAHQWLYNLVGSDQLGHPWLDEALVQYLTWYYYQQRYGDASAQEFRRILEDYWAIVNRRAVPVGLSSQSYDVQSYSAIIYGRGALFLEAIAERIGEVTLLQALRDYSQAHAWRNAYPEDFQAAVENRCACDMGEIFAWWLHGE